MSKKKNNKGLSDEARFAWFLSALVLSGVLVLLSFLFF
jgi:hypothetical protein